MKMKETEDYVASLDIGTDKMAMALGMKDEGLCRLVGVESVGSEGIGRGWIENGDRVRSQVRCLLERFKDEYGFDIDCLNVALPGKLLRCVMKTETDQYRRPQVIAAKDLNALEKRCRGAVVREGEEIVGVLPLCFEVDAKRYANPIGVMAGQLKASYQVYSVRTAVLARVRGILAEAGVREVVFYPVADALRKAVLERGKDRKSFAVVDMGAAHVQVTVIVEGLVAFDVALPLGCDAIDNDINIAYSLRDKEKARLLKEEYGEALRVETKSRKVIIPGTNSSIDCHDLTFVEQCRLEELLEGALFQIQRSGHYKDLEGGILLTGGGSRIKNIGILLNRLSGLSVRLARVMNMHAKETSLLAKPEYLVALGLLMCECPVEEKAGKFKGAWDWFFKG